MEGKPAAEPPAILERQHLSFSRVSMAGSTKKIKGMSKNHLRELKTELLRPIQTSLCLPSANSYSKYSKHIV